MVASAGTEYQKRTLAALERGIRDKREERGFVVDRNGRIVGKGVGGRSRVVVRGRFPEGSIVTHNHPSGLGFSVSDWKNHYLVGTLETRAVGLRDGIAQTHVLRAGSRLPTPDDWIEVQRVMLDAEMKLLTKSRSEALAINDRAQEAIARLLGGSYERFED